MLLHIICLLEHCRWSLCQCHVTTALYTRPGLAVESCQHLAILPTLLCS